MTPFQIVSSVEGLRSAWRQLFNATPTRHRGTSGVDRESVAQFAGSADRNLRSLAAELRGGTFGYTDLKAHIEPKPNGGVRIICVPTVRDRIVQRSVLDYLTGQANPRYRLENEISYGFIKERTVRHAVERAVTLRTTHPWAYKTDISAFFDQIRRDELKLVIQRFIRVSSIHKLLTAAIDCEIRPRDDAQKKEIRNKGLKLGLGVRQGMPLSPYFANLVLRQFDAAIEARGFQAVRYADDLIFFGDSENACLEIDAFCRAQLATIGLSVPPLGTSKTSISAPDEPAEFLGVSLEQCAGGYLLKLSDRQLQSKRDRMFQLVSADHIEANKLTLTDVMRKIEGRTNGWLGAYEHVHNFRQFEDKLRDWKALALEQLFREQLGMNSLSQVQKRFLGLLSYG